MNESQLRAARVVIVDDQEANVRLLERILAVNGFTNVCSFRSGAAFIETLDIDDPDLVLLDLHMPPPDGFAVLDVLRSRGGPQAYRPVLVLTADAEPTARSRALVRGAKDFLVKPLDAEEVVLRVRNLLETRLLHKALEVRNAHLAAEVASLRALEVSERRRMEHLRRHVRAIVSKDAFAPVFQPIVRLDDGQLVGYEALTRFANGVSPDRQFAAAAEAGLGLELEMACLGAAIREAGNLGGQRWLSLNVSPGLITDAGRLASVLTGNARVVLEITEHAPIVDYPALRSALGRLGPDLRWAVDDAGAGYASFRHILELQPAFVKLDMGLVRAIAQDPARQALVAGMVHFAKTTACQLIAEGIETPAEAETLRRLGVGLGQGYLIGRPAPASTTRSAARTGNRRPSGSATASDRGHPGGDGRSRQAIGTAHARHA